VAGAVRGWTGQGGLVRVMPGVLHPDYQLFFRAWLQWGFTFWFRIEEGKCKVMPGDRRAELVASEVAP